MSPFIEFKVLNRKFTLGSGNITVIQNNDGVPIDTGCVVIQEDNLNPIVKVETPGTSYSANDWTIFTDRATVGDKILIWIKGNEKKPAKLGEKSTDFGEKNLQIRL